MFFIEKGCLRTWVNNDGKEVTTQFFFEGDSVSSIESFRENVNLIIQDLTGYNLDLDRYVEISEGQIKTMVTNGKIMESERMTDQTLDFQKIIYTGIQGNFNLKFEQYFWVVGDKAFVLTLTCEETRFEDYKLTAKRFLAALN